MSATEDDEISTAVLIFAHFLGIDVETEQHLLYIAEDALSRKGLPAGWNLGIGDNDNDGIPYFFNTETGESVWNHPREAVFMRKVKEEKEKDKKKKVEKERRAAAGGGQRDTRTPTKAQKPVKVEKEKVDQTKAHADDVMEITEFEDEPFATSSGHEAVTSNDTKSTAAASAFEFDASLDEGDNNPPKKAEKPRAKTTRDTRERDEPGERDSTANSASINSGGWISAGHSKAEKREEVSTPIRVTGPPVPSRNNKSSNDGWASRDEKNRPNTSAGVQERPAKMLADRPGTAGDNPRNREATRENLERERAQRERARERERERDRAAADERERNARRLRAERPERAESRSSMTEGRAKEDSRRELEDERRRVGGLESEIKSLRDRLHAVEGALDDERQERRMVEDRMSRQQGENEDKLRETNNTWENKLREAVRTERAEIETDWKEKIKQIERRGQEDLEASRDDMRLAKARQGDMLKEMEVLRKRVDTSKEDAQLESKLQLEKLHNELIETETKSRALSLELRKLREEHIEVSSRLAAALQSKEVAVAEAEAAKSQASAIVSEGKSSHTALVQATNRIQALDSECARLKAENLLQRKEADSQLHELRKLQQASGMSIEKINLAEGDARRVKAAMQAEANRLSAKATESDAVIEVLRSQLDAAGAQTNEAVREVEKSLDKSLFENVRIQERVKELEQRTQHDQERVLALEREIVLSQDSSFNKDREIRESKIRAESVQARMDDLRDSHSKELDRATEALNKAREEKENLVSDHRLEIERLKAEVADKIPKITAAAVEKLDVQYKERLDSEVKAMRARFEMHEDRARREMFELQATQAEKEARQRVQLADERADYERAKSHNQRLLRQIDSLEAEVDRLAGALRKHSRIEAWEANEGLIEAGEPPSSSTTATRTQPSTAVPEGGDASQLNNMSTAQEDDTAMAVSQLQGQLVWMKAQLSMALDRTAEKNYNVDRSLNMDANYHSTYTPHTDRTAGRHTSIRQPKVTFSPEMLWASPVPRTCCRRFFHTVFDRRTRTNTPPSRTVGTIVSAANARMTGTVRPEKHQQAAGAGTEPAENAPSFADQSAIDRSYADYIDGAGDNIKGAERNVAAETVAAAQRGWDVARELAGTKPLPGIDADVEETKSAMLAEEMGMDSFEAIQDGGYHEGYWKARYSK